MQNFKIALWRIASGLGFIGFSYFISQQWMRTDFFSESCGCGAAVTRHVTTFWPLLFLMLCGWLLLAISLFGARIILKNAFKTRSVTTVLWWSLASTWLLMCAYVFIHNLSMAVVTHSFMRAGIFLAIVGVVVGLIALLIYLWSYPSRQRRQALLADLAKIDEASQQEIIQLIDQHARRQAFQLFYRPKLGLDAAAVAYEGGNPLARADEVWPLNQDGTPAIFLLQLPLHAPRLNAAWQGRVLCLYLRDWEILVRSYAANEQSELVSMSNPAADEFLDFHALQAIAIPFMEVASEDDEGLDAKQLIAQLPELRAKLAALSSQPVALLSMILSTGTYGRTNTNWSTLEADILVGGAPHFIQNEHDPVCEICHEPMRFLLQFEDMTNDLLLGDAGVGYVYGCDAHPEHCQGFVDCC